MPVLNQIEMEDRSWQSNAKSQKGAEQGAEEGSRKDSETAGVTAEKDHTVTEGSSPSVQSGLDDGSVKQKTAPPRYYV